jgi:MFS family permease
MLSGIRQLTVDGRLLFSTRFVRLFAYGLLSVVLVLYLDALGLSEANIGLLFTLALVGDTAISLWLTTRADRLGRRKMLLVGAGLMVLAGVVFSVTGNFWLLVIAATIGVISPSGNEVGPFLAIEQSSLSQAVPGEHRTSVFAWYNLAGSVATALGALGGGLISQFGLQAGLSAAMAYRPVVLAYAAMGLVLAGLFTALSPAVETSVPSAMGISRWGLHRSQRVVWKLSSLFALDAFAGGLVIQSFLAYWFHIRFGVEAAWLGGIFFGANLLAGISALLAGWLANQFGLVNTMVFTHLPSNVLLMLVPLMPNLPLATTVLLLRFAISQMDVPTRQAYTMAVVSPDERSAAAGLTGVARSIGAALSPALAGPLLGNPLLMSAPFFLAGSLKIVYDLLLYRAFITVQPNPNVETDD